MKNFFLKKRNAPIYITILASFIVISIIIIAISLRPATQEENNVSANGRHDLDFRVFYFQNDIFDENPIPRNLNFLMSYTDYIEVESTFSASFSEEVYITYSYSSYKRFVIRHGAGSDANLNPIVFEKVIDLSSIEGSLTGNQINFEADETRGLYTITPLDHIYTYFEFVADVNRQIAAQGIFPQGPRGFSAELFIEFTYVVSAPQIGFSQTSNRGYRVALTNEIYSAVITGGNQNFQWQTNLTIDEGGINTPLIVLLCIIIILSTSGILYSLKLLNFDDSNTSKSEANIILSKYSKEIVIYTSKAEDVKLMYVTDFKDLLKLAIAKDTLICCYKDDTLVQFYIIVDGFASVYEINVENTNETKREEKRERKNKKQKSGAL